ncbi:hypothetical protein [Bizionia arctica]|uniref:T9SS type A sorting domain-containing protein n=1 Tax=Bizionia arctica TaxID=1495645 RepID=A0A917GG13_9FLAO|nr:hypothetical protein [Bizionia arctica]GGG43978.1 hypothetical protein GCM10010976_14460 [Bizionia arctica]
MNKLIYLLLISLCTTTLTNANPFSKEITETYDFNEIQRVRLDFTMPNGYVRHLLLAFTPDNAATEGIDYGYDAQNVDNFPDDLNWMIEGERYVIQGVGEFDNTNHYPLGMFITNAGDITIALNSLENFDTDIDIFIFDAFNNTYTLLNEMDFQENVSPGTYLDRYSLAFTNNLNDNGLNINDYVSSVPNTSISYLRKSQEILVLSNKTITKMEIFNLMGKRILDINNINKRELRLPFLFTKETFSIVRVHTNLGATNKKLALQ